MSLKEDLLQGIKAVAHPDLGSSVSGHLTPLQERMFVGIYGEEVATQAFHQMRKLPEREIAHIGATALVASSTMKTAGLKPSPDLFDSNVYTLFDKTPEQIAVDAKAIRDRLDFRKELQFKMKCVNGEAVKIDLSGKTADEITLLNRKMNAEAAKRAEREANFSDNPIIGGLDYVSAVVTPVFETIGKTAKATTNFVKDNPGMSIAGALGGGAVVKMLMNGGLGNIDFGDLLLVGSILLVGSTWMHSNKPEMFNNFAAQFGIDGFFNKAPQEPMFKFMETKERTREVSERHDTDNKASDKFRVSAEVAGGTTTMDALHSADMQESVRQLKETPVSNVAGSKSQARHLS